MSQRFQMAATAFALLAALGWTSAAAQEAQEISLEDSRKIFASNCSWCHGSFGKKAGKGGPKLAGTPRDEEALFQTILKGQNAMPSFKNTLSEEKIRALARYIKSLPADEPPAQ